MFFRRSSSNSAKASSSTGSLNCASNVDAAGDAIAADGGVDASIASLDPAAIAEAEAQATGFYGQLNAAQTVALAKMWLGIFVCMKSEESLFAHAGKTLKTKRLGSTDDPAVRKQIFEYIRYEAANYGGLPADSVLLRFLRARRFDITKAFDAMMDSLNFRVDFDVQKILRHGDRDFVAAMYTITPFQNSKRGFPLVYLDASRHIKGVFPLADFKNLIIHTVETLRLLVKFPIERMAMAFDLGSLSYKNMDLDGMLFLINTLQNYYPESLGEIFVIDSNFIFKGFWKLISPVIDPVIRAKIKFISKKELSQFIEPAVLLKSFGGEFDYTFKFTPPDAQLLERFDKAATPEFIAAQQKILIDAQTSHTAHSFVWAAKVLAEANEKPFLGGFVDAKDPELIKLINYYVHDMCGIKDDLFAMTVDALEEKRKLLEQTEVVPAWVKVDKHLRLPSYWHRQGIFSIERPDLLADWSKVKPDSPA